MKQIIGNTECEVIPWASNNDCYCYELNRLVPRHNAWVCQPRQFSERYCNHNCIQCSLSAEYLYAEEQKWVDKGKACWTKTTDGKILAVQYTKYGFKNRKNKDMVHIEPKIRKNLKPYIKPETTVLKDVNIKEWEPENCGYGLYIKNTYRARMGDGHYKQIPIGWTCKHPQHPNILYRPDMGYYPFCVGDCPKKIEWIKGK